MQKKMCSFSLEDFVSFHDGELLRVFFGTFGEETLK